MYDRLAPMCQTYANFPCASVINYRYEARDGLEEWARAYVAGSIPLSFVGLPVVPGMCSEVMADMLVFLCCDRCHVVYEAAAASSEVACGRVPTWSPCVDHEPWDFQDHSIGFR